MKLIDRDTRADQEFHASLHGARLQGPHGGTIGGRRRSHMERMKARRRGAGG